MHIRNLLTVSAFCAATVLAGCASTEPMAESPAVGPENTMGAEMRALEARKAELSLREAELRRREQAMANSNTRIGGGMQNAANDMPTPDPRPDGQQFGPAQLPPNAETGECFARIYIQPKYETVERRVKVRDASDRIEIVPAEYAKVKERVLVAEESEKLVVVPATYGFIEERVLVEPAKEKVVEIPAEYETLTERVLVKPARKVWKQGRGPIQRIDESTGEIMCLVEEPAEYKTIKRRVLKTPAQTKKVVVPAKYDMVKKKVVKTPATTKTVTIPAKYREVMVTKLVKQAQEVRVPVPEEFDVVTEERKVSEGRVEWRSILCETNMTPGKIRQIQQALKARGYNPGGVDGQVGPGTMNAVRAFQRANGLPVDRYLNIDTLKALGISPSS